MTDEKNNNSLSPSTKRHLYILIGVMFAIAVLGIIYREYQYMQLRSATNKLAVLAVTTTKATPSPRIEELVLPGNVAAWHDATIYARTNGYVTQWNADIGTHVKEGDVLALIATPEVNQQLQQAEADLKTAEANSELAQSTAKRWLILLQTNSVSKQDAEVRVSNAKAQEAIVVSTRANRDRLKDLVNFQRVLAPFDGVIMSRTTDIGRLINAGSGSMLPLFRIVQSDHLRVYVRVPQIYAGRIVPKLTAQLNFSEHPGKKYFATLLNTAKAIDANTRTLLIQLVTNNPDGELLPGGYVEVHLLLPANPNAVRLPVNTLLFRSEGLQVGTIDTDHKVSMKTVKIGRDYGDFVEIDSGIKPNEVVILNPSDSLFDGEEVSVAEKPTSSQGNPPA